MQAARKLVKLRTFQTLKRTFLAPTCAIYCTQVKAVKPFSTNYQKIDPEDARKINWQSRVDLTAAYRGLEMMDFQEGICNHLSLIAPTANGIEEVMLMMPYGYHWTEATPELLVGVSNDGKVIEGNGEVEVSALTIHHGIHRANPDSVCAFHVHPPNATALGMMKNFKFGMYHQNSLYFYDDFEYDRHYGGFSLDLDEGDRIAKQIKNKKVLFMCNHGVMVVGPSVADVIFHTYYLERACMFQCLAMSCGQELQEIPDDLSKETKENAKKILDMYTAPFFASMKRLLDKKYK